MSPVFEIKKEIPDESFLRQASCATAPVGVLAFWGGMLMAARRYPSEYDWRYTPVSNLVSPDHNPAGYLWASTGIVLCSLCGLCWVAYWAKDIPFEAMRKSIENALCFGVYHKGRQVGFARVVTDCVTTAYLGDVFIWNPTEGGGWESDLSRRSLTTLSFKIYASGSLGPRTPMACT